MYILNDISSYGYSDELLDIVSLVSIFCGVLVVISKNPVVSVLFLIGLFSTIALYLIMLGAM